MLGDISELPSVLLQASSCELSLIPAFNLWFTDGPGGAGLVYTTCEWLNSLSFEFESIWRYVRLPRVSKYHEGVESQIQLVSQEL